MREMKHVDAGWFAKHCARTKLQPVSKAVGLNRHYGEENEGQWEWRGKDMDKPWE